MTDSTGPSRDTRVVMVDADAADDNDGSSLRSWIETHAQPGQRVVMLLGADDCFAVRTQIADLARRGREQAMVYRIEESLPLDAEDVAVGFLGEGNCRLAIAASTAQIEPELRGLEAAGLVVQSIMPEAIIAAEAGLDMAEQHKGAKPTLCLAGEDQQTYDLYQFERGRPSANGFCRDWQHFKSPARLRMQLLADPPQSLLILGGLPLGFDLPNPNHHKEWNRAAAVANHCDAILRHQIRPSIDLAQTTNARLRPAGWSSRLQRPLAAVAAAAVLLLASTTITGWLGLQEAQHASAQDERQLRESFMKAYPGQPVPVSLLSRLRSEAQRANYLHLTSTQPNASADTQRTEIVQLLADIFEALPSDLRFRVNDLRLDPRRVYLTGQARSHADAQRLSEALRAVPGLIPDPPRTERQADRGVLFTLQAELLHQRITLPLEEMPEQTRVTLPLPSKLVQTPTRGGQP